LNKPSLLVVTVLSTPVAVLVISTLAFGMPLPEGSETVPENVPPATCATAGTENKITSRRKIDALRPNECTAAEF
jgi:hypothetical protein